MVRGCRVARLTFTDESYFDYRVTAGYESDDFWTQAQVYHG
ncbi:hypothetical protein [Klugiella xanthotipulae]|nr:hypothetical protein [Klugiella xanthotipulae]